MLVIEKKVILYQDEEHLSTMDQLAITYLNINKKFLASIGLWPHQSGFIKNLLLFNLLLFIGSQGYFQVFQCSTYT